MHCIAIDFRNAFNSVSRKRIAEEVTAFPRIVRLFDLLYATASPLLWHGETLLSTEGTRQGDVLGAALFSLALHPCLVDLEMKFGALVKIRAYMSWGIHILDAKYLSKAVAKHGPLFESLTCLDPEVAFAILRFCGWPRLNFLCRVMPDMSAHAKVFDGMILETFLSIARITGPLNDKQKALIQLPLRAGGFGLRSYERLAQDCYEASSIKGSNSEAARTHLIDVEVQTFVDSDTVWRQHREAVAKRFSTDWLRSPSDFAFKPGDFARAMQLRLGAAAPWDESKTLEVCRCGYASTSAHSHELHLVSCAVHPGLGPHTRHDAVRDAMARYLREHGATVSVEPTVSNGRADLQVIIPDLGVDTTMDFVISGEAGARSSLAAKLRKYKGQDVVAADATVLGGISGRFSKVISSVTIDSGQRQELRELISKTIQAMNGKILQRRNPQPVTINCSESSDSESQSDDERIEPNQTMPLQQQCVRTPHENTLPYSPTITADQVAPMALSSLVTGSVLQQTQTGHEHALCDTRNSEQPLTFTYPLQTSAATSSAAGPPVPQQTPSGHGTALPELTQQQHEINSCGLLTSTYQPQTPTALPPKSNTYLAQPLTLTYLFQIPTAHSFAATSSSVLQQIPTGHGLAPSSVDASTHPVPDQNPRSLEVTNGWTVPEIEALAKMTDDISRGDVGCLGAIGRTE